MRDVYRYDAWFTRVPPSKFTSRYIFFYFNSSNEKNPKKEERSTIYSWKLKKKTITNYITLIHAERKRRTNYNDTNETLGAGDKSTAATKSQLRFEEDKMQQKEKKEKY